MKKLISLFLVIMTAYLVPASGNAAGLWLYEQAAPDMGLATAGRAALAQDASTVGANPAGMTLLERNQLEGGLLGIFVDAKFDADSTTFGGGDGGNAGGFVPAGSFSYVHGITTDLKVGLTAGSNFGKSWVAAILIPIWHNANTMEKACAEMADQIVKVTTH